MTSTVSPRQRVQSTISRIPELAGPGARRLSVLVVDPDPEFQRLIQQEICNRGHIALALSNCTDAWVTMQSMRFDVVIVDLDTPAITATELARRASQLPSSPAMVATSHNIMSDNKLGRDLCKRNGYQAVIHKAASTRSVLRDIGNTLAIMEKDGPKPSASASGV